MTRDKCTSSALADVYRTPEKPSPPCCRICLEPMSFDVMWVHWHCRACGICDCEERT